MTGPCIEQCRQVADGRHCHPGTSGQFDHRANQALDFRPAAGFKILQRRRTGAADYPRALDPLAGVALDGHAVRGGNGFGFEIPEHAEPLEIGRGRIVREGTDVAILSYGARLQECVQAADILKAKNISVTVADARFAKPLDEKLVTQLLRNHKAVMTIEEGSSNGFGALVMHFAANSGLLDNGTCKLRTMHLPDIFQDHDKPEKQYDEAGLNAAQIVRTVLAL